jgi:hypothetical protein
VLSCIEDTTPEASSTAKISVTTTSVAPSSPLDDVRRHGGPELLRELAPDLAPLAERR